MDAPVLAASFAAFRSDCPTPAAKLCDGRLLQTLGSQPWDYFIPWDAECSADYGGEGEAPPSDVLRRPNLVLDYILGVSHIDSRFVSAPECETCIIGKMRPQAKRTPHRRRRNPENRS
jgi:hypothetical protein